MSKYMIKEFNKPLPEWSDANCCIAGKKDDNYTITIDHITIAISPEEKEDVLSIWSKIDSGELKNS